MDKERFRITGTSEVVMIEFTDKAPIFHQRVLKALLASTNKAKAAEVRAEGVKKGWNN